MPHEYPEFWGFFSNFYFSTVTYNVSGVKQSESVYIYLLDSFPVEVIAEY